jgi:H+-transporting ATPase
LVLVAVLASIPVALPSMFTLAATVGARAVARRGVLPTRLSALDEAAGMDLLCADKTGTLTRNELAVTACRALPGFDEAQILAMAALASADGGADTLDAAIRTASQPGDVARWKLVRFTPFDPTRKMSEAAAIDPENKPLRIVKGAFAVVAAIAESAPPAAAMVEELQAKGFRVLVVAVGSTEPLRIAGVIALSDPPREDSAALIAQLHGLGVRTVMITGDAPVTARDYNGRCTGDGPRRRGRGWNHRSYLRDRAVAPRYPCRRIWRLRWRIARGQVRARAVIPAWRPCGRHVR